MSRETAVKPIKKIYEKEFFELSYDERENLCEFTENLLDKTYLSLENNFNCVRNALQSKCDTLQPIHKQFIKDYDKINEEYYEKLKNHFKKYDRR